MIEVLLIVLVAINLLASLYVSYAGKKTKDTVIGFERRVSPPAGEEANTEIYGGNHVEQD